MNIKFPFDPKVKHHILIAIGLAVWIFVFLYFTEPLDVNEFNNSEKLLFLPVYGLIAAGCYVLVLPLQKWLYVKNEQSWSLKSEILFITAFSTLTYFIVRGFYLYIIMDNNPLSYSSYYFFTSIYIPAILTVLPILLIGRFAFGKYKDKKAEENKIEIKGEGSYEGLRLLESDLIMLEASDNYVEVHYLDQGVLKKQLIRARLSQLEKDHPTMLRTQRSFLINPVHFISYKSEKNKLGLVLTQQTFAPVSKTYTPAVKEALNFTTK